MHNTGRFPTPELVLCEEFRLKDIGILWTLKNLQSYLHIVGSL
jgi:hypothetical protein